MPKTEDDYLLLKFNNLKSWKISSPPALSALQEYFDAGTGPGVLATHLTDRQKELLCIVIDECQGTIQLDWSGDFVTKDEAKDYVMEGT